MASYVDADPVPVVLAHLKAHPAVLGEVESEGAISGLREAPWPHIRVTTGVAGSLGHVMSRTASPEVSFEVWGHPDGRDGDAKLRRICAVVLEALLELPDLDYVPGTPVIHDVRPTAAMIPQTLTNGQRRWTFSVIITLRSPQG